MEGDKQDVACKERATVERSFYSATAWLLGNQLITRLVNFGSGIIIARLLAPVDFGLMSLALTFSNLITLVGNIGVGHFLIYRREEKQEYLTAGFWLALTASAGLFCLQAAAAPLVATFYGNATVASIMIVYGVAFYLIAPLGSIHNVLLQKRMHFRRLVIPQLATTVLSTILTIVMASLGFGVWSLVIPSLLAFPVSVVLSWRLCEWRPSLRLHTKHWGEMFRYGKNVLGNDLVNYVNSNIDYIIIGKLLGPSLLGLYTFAFNQSTMIVLLLYALFSQVVFPILARLQSESDVLRASTMKFARIGMALVIPITFLQFVVAEEFIRVIYGSKWAEAVAPFRWLLLFALGRSVTLGLNELINAVGRPDIGFKYSLVTAPVLTAAVVVGSRWGIVGVAAGVGLVMGVSALGFVWLVFGVMRWRLGEFGRAIMPSLVSAVVVFTVSFLTHYLAQRVHLTDWLDLTAVVLFGGAAHLITLRMFFAFEMNEIREQIGTMWRDLRARLIQT
jgi:PST family polysaccharide transporter